MAPPADLRTHALYRFFDVDGQLLYIGVTVRAGFRWQAHASEKGWWPLVASVSLTHYWDRDEALRAEQQAIETERPRYNVVHASDPEPDFPRPSHGVPIPAGMRKRLQRLRRRQVAVGEDRVEIIAEALAIGVAAGPLAESLGMTVRMVQRVGSWESRRRRERERAA